MFSSRFLNALFPPVCLGCRKRVETVGALCSECFSHLKFITAPACLYCGKPLPGGEEKAKLCGNCLQHKPPYHRASAPLCYEEMSRKLILGLKYGDRLEVVPTFARFMVHAGADILKDADLLVPVPLHWKRLLIRKYNQAAVLSEAVTKLSGVPTDSFVLKRKKATPKQGGFSKSERYRNVDGVFMFNSKKTIEGKVIVLIDDVMASGATVSSCAKELYAHGAAEVRILTLAKSID